LDPRDSKDTSREEKHEKKKGLAGATLDLISRGDFLKLHTAMANSDNYDTNSPNKYLKHENSSSPG
jgi:hypothetical protein